MRVVWAILAVLSASGQDAATYQSFSVDVNGHRIAGSQITTTKTKTSLARTERLQSINGRMVPVEQISERVIRDDSSGRVVERTVQRFDPDGHPSPPELSLIERESRPGGTTTVRTTTSQLDINGHLQLIERSFTETQKAAASESSETSIERPAIDGSLEVVEKRSVLKTGSAEAFRQRSTTYRRDTNGFYEAVRVITDRTKGPTTTTDQTAEYESGPGGSLELHSETARKSVRHPDGSETEVTDTLGKSLPGVASDSGSGLKLQEREIVERATGADGSVRETLLRQRPTLTDPTVFGTPQVVAETICKGKCHE